MSDMNATSGKPVVGVSVQEQERRDRVVARRTADAIRVSQNQRAQHNALARQAGHGLDGQEKRDAVREARGVHKQGRNAAIRAALEGTRMSFLCPELSEQNKGCLLTTQEFSYRGHGGNACVEITVKIRETVTLTGDGVVALERGN
jgi:hypothetical protein